MLILRILILFFSCNFFSVLSQQPMVSYQGPHGANSFNMTAQLYGTGSGGAITIPVPVWQGGTGATMLTQYGVLIGQGVNPIQATTAGATGTVLIGNTSANPSFSDSPIVTKITILNAPVDGTDGTNKDYVDLFVSGLNIQSGCVAGSTVPLTATYADGSDPLNPGIGATLTNAGTQATFTLDDVTLALNDRVLIKDQTSTLQNGIYTVTVLGTGSTNWVLTRATDYDTPAEVTKGDLVPVEFGTINANTFWLETSDVVTIGVSPITFAIFLRQGILSVNADTGFATGTTITLAGGQNITTTGDDVGTITIAVSGVIPVANGGTGDATLGVNQVLAGGATANTDPVQSIANSLATYVLTSNGSGSLPSFQDVSASGAIKTITGDNAVALSGSNINFTGGTTGLLFNGSGTTETLTGTLAVASGGTGRASLTVNQLIAGGAASSTDAVQSISNSTANLVLTSNGAGSLPSFKDVSVSGAIKTITGDNAVALSGSNINFTGGTTGLLFNGSGTTETLTGTLVVGNGGTGNTTLTSNGVLYGNGTSALSVTAQGGANTALIANSGAPSFGKINLTNTVTGTLPVANGGTGDATLGVNQVLAGGATANTDPIQSITNGTTNFVLTSNGTGSLPSFKDVSVSGAIKTITGDNAVALSGSNINFTGGTTGLLFNGSGTTETVTGTLVVANGGTGNTTLTSNGVLYGNGTSALLITAQGGANTALIANSGAPSFGKINLTNTVTGTLPVANGGTGDATLGVNQVLAGGATANTDPIQSITNGTTNFVLTSNGTGSLPSFKDVSVSGAIKTITGDNAVALSGSNINFTGGTTGLLFNGSGTTETVTGTLVVANGGTGNTTLTSNGVLYGNGTSALLITAQGGANTALIANSGAPSFGKINLTNTVTGTLPVANGGTGDATLTAHAVLIGEGTSAVAFAGPNSGNGVPLISQGSSSDPIFGTALVNGGGTGVTSLTQYALLAGGAASTTAAVQQVSNVSATAGQVLTYVSSSALPVWASASQTVLVNLSVSDITGLATTPKLVITGVTGSVIYVISAMLKLTNVTTAFASATGTIDLVYTGTGGTNIISGLGSNAFVTSGVTNLMGGINGGQTVVSSATLTGASVYLSNPGAAFTGGGSSTIQVAINYILIPFA